MTHNPPPSLPPQRATTTAAGATVVCGHCCSDDRWILHNVRHRGLYRKLCTSCVLKLHPTSFCPTCFSLHEPTASLSPLTTGKTLTCFKCSSLSHVTCVPPNAPKSPYLCPPCTNPNFKFFDIRKPRKDPGQSDGGDCLEQLIDEKKARVLLAAARVAAGSMIKAGSLARVEMERKVKESVVAKKRAKEAIDLVMLLSTRLSVRPNPNPSPRTNVVPMRMGRASNGGVTCAVLSPEIKNAGGSGADGRVSGAMVVVGAKNLQSNGCGDKKHEGGGKEDGTKA